MTPGVLFRSLAGRYRRRGSLVAPQASSGPPRAGTHLMIAETELWLCKIAPLRLSFGDQAPLHVADGHEPAHGPKTSEKALEIIRSQYDALGFLAEAHVTARISVFTLFASFIRRSAARRPHTRPATIPGKSCGSPCAAAPGRRNRTRVAGGPACNWLCSARLCDSWLSFNVSATARVECLR
jgi:hypothetical protein